MSKLSGWYVEQPRCISVVAGKYTLRPHWKGLGNESELRSIMRMASAAPALYEACLAAVKGIGAPIMHPLAQDALHKVAAALALVEGDAENLESAS